MKKILLTSIMFTTILFGCSSSSNDDLTEASPNPDPDPAPTTKVTYNGSVKAIITSNCNNCHGSPVRNGAPMSLTTYAQVKASVETGSLIARINSTSNPMPQSGLMSQNNRTLIQQWKDDGFLEN
ncbi:hypothetical protein [Mariniflexile sp. AS56]|uniref:hypothetical protein n=1 Tax=Mariniflexile sp. AS56 TaxID=3063957 RepID=UPI0026F125F0|nr:hypothetical protein [Mariniflexile sp. AS56]MDO7170639.1 hypothetical protein [Mariniflexile sp. AS56]